MPLPGFSKQPQQFLREGKPLSRQPGIGRGPFIAHPRFSLHGGLPGLPPAGEESRQPTPAAPPPHLNTRRRRVRRARREPKMAVCGRVRRMFRLSAALQLLLLVAAGVQNSHGQGQGPGVNFGPFAGQAGGGNPVGQQPPQLSQLSQQQQQQQPPPQQQQPFPAGGLPARRGGAGPGGTGGGWKLAEEESCREDVTRVCPKHTWSNNLAVLECLQDVREVRRWDGPGRRAEPGAGRRVSPAWKPRMPGCSFPHSFPLGLCSRFSLSCPSLPGAFEQADPTPILPSPVPYFAPCRGVLGSGPRLTASVGEGLRSVFLFALLSFV